MNNLKKDDPSIPEVAIDDFIHGMGNLNLLPSLEEIPETNLYSAWHDVGDAFKAVGDSMWQAIEEFSKEITA